MKYGSPVALGRPYVCIPGPASDVLTYYTELGFDEDSLWSDGHKETNVTVDGAPYFQPASDGGEEEFDHIDGNIMYFRNPTNATIGNCLYISDVNHATFYDYITMVILDAQSVDRCDISSYTGFIDTVACQGSISEENFLANKVLSLRR